MPEKFPIQLGAYALLQELGRGGFATVYLARDETRGRDVAVKVLDDKLARDPGFISRFEQEFQIAQRLDHPNIVKMFERGEIQGRYFLVMGLVRGSDLRTRIRNTGALAVPVALHIAGQIAAALDYAHAQGVIHRDIKAANILLDESGNALLGDFGLMRAAEGSLFMTTFSQSSGFLGTAEYISPEQARGEAATASSDVYSFAVVIFEMLTGVVPFHADQPLAVIRKHADEPPPNPLDLRADLPPALANQVWRALAKRPADRPKSARALVEQMQTALNAEQQAIATQAEKILKGREAAVLLARARIEETKRQRDEAERARRFAEAQAAELDKLATETETLLKELQTEEAQARQAAQDAEKARREAEQKLNEAQNRVGRAERSLEQFQSGNLYLRLICPGCGSVFELGNDFCDNCGSSLATAPTQSLTVLPPAFPPPQAQAIGNMCPSCNTPYIPGATFCDNCGTMLRPAVAPPQAPTTGGVCPSCSTLNLPGTAFCDNCGAALSAVPPNYSLQCPNCKNQTQPGSTFCDQCGTSLTNPPPIAVQPPPPFSSIDCPNCGNHIPSESTFCDQCGATVGGMALSPSSQPAPPRTGSSTCPKCGAQNRGGAKFCWNCRSPLPTTPIDLTSKQKERGLAQLFKRPNKPGKT